MANFGPIENSPDRQLLAMNRQTQFQPDTRVLALPGHFQAKKIAVIENLGISKFLIVIHWLCRVHVPNE
jgi:hypothetical protein